MSVTKLSIVKQVIVSKIPQSRNRLTKSFASCVFDRVVPSNLRALVAACRLALNSQLRGFNFLTY